MPTETDDQLTFWGKDEEPLNSEYGTLLYKEWCRREADRIARAHPCFVRRNGSPQCAIFLGRPRAEELLKVLHIGRVN